jgi:hypothetical protein
MTGDAHGRGEQGSAEVVDPVSFLDLPRVEAHPHHDQRESGERKADEEGPAPGRVVGDPAAGGGADHGGNAEDDAHQALPLSALSGRNHVADHGDPEWDQPAGAETLDGAAGNQHLHRGCEPGDDRSR